jgi:hypothetical protein
MRPSHDDALDLIALGEDLDRAQQHGPAAQILRQFVAHAVASRRASGGDDHAHVHRSSEYVVDTRRVNEQ